jgi:hypothetical protein
METKIIRGRVEKPCWADERPGVDYDAAGAAMGIEITASAAVRLEDLNALLRQLGQPALPQEEWAPARAA